jgi:GNAT superfamily N-acetyltransferase
MMIRSLVPSDRSALIQLLGRVTSFNQEDQALAVELIDICLNQPSQTDYAFLLAVDAENQLIGYACFGPTPLTEGTYDLYWIVVDQRSAGQGVGTHLLRAVEEAIHVQHGRMLLIETSSAPNYERSRHFYLKNGYHLCETIVDFYRPGEDRVTYLKRF